MRNIRGWLAPGAVGVPFDAWVSSGVDVTGTDVGVGLV